MREHGETPPGPATNQNPSKLHRGRGRPDGRGRKASCAAVDQGRLASHRRQKARPHSRRGSSGVFEGKCQAKTSLPARPVLLRQVQGIACARRQHGRIRAADTNERQLARPLSGMRNDDAPAYLAHTIGTDSRIPGCFNRAEFLTPNR